MIVILIAVSFLIMEFVAWSNHKYVMHGFLWSLHRDHHLTDIASRPVLQKNDLFFIIYALPAIVLIIAGLSSGNNYLTAVGGGITLYGFTYFILHDVVIHRRLPILRTLSNSYIRALVRAHEGHHKPTDLNDFRCYGLLVFPLRYFK